MTRPTGVDISRWQDPAHDADVFKGADFAGIRATYGTAPDTAYAAHEANARKAGAVVIAYCFGRAGDPVAQARATVAAAPHADLYALDVESDGASPGMSAQGAVGWLAGMRGLTGKKLVLYHSESGYPHVGQDLRWVANWDGQPAIPWDFWQWSGSPLDRDQFNGTHEQLAALAGHRPPIASWTLHLSAGATVMLAHLAASGCIDRWSSKKWSTSSSAPCTAPRRFEGCESGSAMLVRVTDGAFKGQLVRLGVGVSATEG